MRAQMCQRDKQRVGRRDLCLSTSEFLEEGENSRYKHAVVVLAWVRETEEACGRIDE